MNNRITKNKIVASLVASLILGVQFPLLAQTNSANLSVNPDQNASQSEATRLAKQANQLSQQGKFREAIPLLEQALKLQEASLRKDHPEIGILLNELALLYTRAYLQSLNVR
ncbi:tetratricopeptide repeat protein [Leptolyngbya sp. AN03gr2]|uniref:tetratricopeptide repeat protein n=1 Tax=unclassified Leptolyngbya TaxID=2650499 RepID=UPI003D31B6A2